MSGSKYNIMTSATISADIVKEIIKAAVEEETGKRVRGVEFNIKAEWRGYGYGEYQAHVFDGITVHFEESARTTER
jgi:hypothetical protein